MKYTGPDLICEACMVDEVGNWKEQKWKWEWLISQHFSTGVGRCRRMLCGLHKFL
jgi:hypothetical protein